MACYFFQLNRGLAAPPRARVWPPSQQGPVGPVSSMNYLTWRQLRARLEKEVDDRVLDEPVLFGLMDAYGTMCAYPVEVLTEFPQPNSQRILVAEEDSEDYELVHDMECDDRPQLRQLPPNGLLLHFSDMEEDAEERTKWLAHPNPHTPPPMPSAAPLFDNPTPSHLAKPQKL